MTTQAELSIEQRIAAAAKEMHAADAAAEKKRKEWEEVCYRGWRAGVSYPEMAALSKLSRARIDQVIRKVRIRRGLPVNSQH